MNGAARTSRRSAGSCAWGPSQRYSLALFACIFVLGISSQATAQSICGNGILEAPESCDDGNLSSADCCSQTCSSIACVPTPPQGAAWEDLGPMNLGGRVTALAIDPQDSNRWIVGTPSAGVWESDNGGLSWRGLAPYLGLLRLSTAAIDPSNPDRLLFGTGEISDGGSQRSGVGLLYSADGGATYQANPPPTNPYMSELLIFDDEPSRVLVATDLGLWISLDGGLTLIPSLRGESISAIERDPFDANAVYAAGRSGLFRSTDRGASFSALATWPSGTLQTGPGPGMATLAASHQTQGRLYATVQLLSAFDSTGEALFLSSDDAGQTLDLLTTAPDFCPVPESCGYAHALAVDPADDARLLLGGDRLYASADSGATWQVVAGSIHGIHEIALYPGGGVIASNSGIAHLDASWSQLETRNNGLAITGIESLDVSPDPTGRILIGTAHDGTALSGPGGVGFAPIFGAGERAGPVAFDPFDPDTFIVSDPTGGLFRSNDLGASFSPIMTGIDTTQGAIAVPPLAANPLVPGDFYTARMQVFATTNIGDQWDAFRPPGFPAVSHLWPSSVDSDRLYFGLTTGGTLYRADDTHTYAMSILPADPSLLLNSVFLDPAAENILFAALTDGSTQKGLIFKSYDFGQSWTDITPRDLPPAHAIVRDRFGALYVGTTQGMYRSANDGFTWTPFQYGLSAFGIRHLELVDDTLYAGTLGRGLFRMPIQELVSIDTIPPGLPVLVDGNLVSSPYFAEWAAGATHTVEPYLLQTADTRQRFASWSDSGALSHTYTAPGGSDWLTAAIIDSYRLSTSVVNGAGGQLIVLPPSPDGFYDSGDFVSVIAVPDADHRLVSLTGELNGVQEGLGFALMDRPRSVQASFEPLAVSLFSEPSGLELDLDGTPITTPAASIWNARSQHHVTAPSRIELGPSDPVDLVFDQWTDLRPRSHAYTTYRDSFIADLSAIFLRTTPQVTLAAERDHWLRSPGIGDAPRSISLTLEANGAAPNISSLLFLRGAFGGTLNIEVPLLPSVPALQHHRFVRGGALDGETRLVLHNPGSVEASVSLLLRAPTGAGLVARVAAILVPASGRTDATMRQLIQLPPVYEGLLTIISDQPVSASVQAVTENLRPSTMLDPVVYAAFGESDPGVPTAPSVQALICGASTEHELVLINTGLVPVSGALALLDEAGSAIAGIPVPGGTLAPTYSYSVAVGGYEVVNIELPGAAPSGTGSLCSAQVRVTPDAAQAPPWLQLTEKQQTGSTLGIPILLPRTLPPSTLHDQVVVPVDRSVRDSGFVATNLSLADVSSSLSLLDDAGVEFATSVVVIPAGTQRVLLTSEVFPSSPVDFRGTLEGASASELAVVGLNVSANDRGEILVSGFPVFSRTAPSSAAALPLYFPHVVDGDTWSAELFLFNPSLSDADLSLIYRGNDGTEAPFPIEAP